SLLPRGITHSSPMPSRDLERLHGRLQDGQPPCGVDGLPACEDLPSILRDAPHLPPDRWGMEFIAGENCIATDTDRPSIREERENLPPCPPTERPPRPDSQRWWCIVLPRPGDPPLSPDEDRPVCPDDEPPPLPAGNDDSPLPINPPPDGQRPPDGNPPRPPRGR
ncbi:MAG: hypothetical protein Q9P01_12465, partial [Anaerolineae bacterium]|nr:hypothetical protein [Anaerolineae bacterium]